MAASIRTAKRTGVFDILNNTIMVIVILLTLYPFWYCLVGSLNSGRDYMKGGVYLWPRSFTLDNFFVVFQEKTIVQAFAITAARTVVGTLLAILVTMLFSYGFSKKYLMGRKIYAFMGIVTMYFSGGMIPEYLNIKALGMMNSFLVYIIPALFTFFNVLIFQSYFQSIPEAMVESARMDGASEYRIFFRLIIPLSIPVVAAISLFTAVGHWNSYYDAMLYTTKPELQTIQLYLVKMVRNKEAAASLVANFIAEYRQNDSVNSTTLQLATMIVTSAPIILTYPFLQRYFIKGVMIGSVKG